MNRVILCGRLTKDPDVRYIQGQNPMAVARYTLAVDRRSRDSEQNADFISCVAFGKSGEFVEKYLKKGTKVIVSGRIQTGSYTNRDGQKVYTTDVVVEDHEFAESKASGGERPVEAPGTRAQRVPDDDGFVNIPDDVDDFGLPFN